MNIRALLAFVSICLVSGAAYAQTPLRVIVFPGGANLPLWVAQEKGLFAHEGVAVKITPTPSSVFLVQSLMKSEQDIALSAFDNVVAYQEGQGEVGLANDPDFFAFMGFSHGTVRLVVAPTIREYADLKGKTLAVDALSTGYSLVLIKLLQLGGLKPDDYQLESVGGTALRARLLMENKYPATILTTPLELLPEAKGYRRLANVQDVLGPYQTIVGMARRSWASSHKEALTAFIRASVAALDWIFDPKNRAEAIAIYRKYVPDAPEPAADGVITAMTGEREGFARGGRIDVDGVMTVLKIRSELGRPPKQLTDPSRYLDDSYLRAAAAK